MPKLHLLLLTLCSLIFATPVYATNDPQSATASATATIPTTTPTTGDVTAPTIPVLISPTDGAVTNQTRPEFVWHQSSDPNGNTILYTLSLNGTATYLGISNNGNSQKYNFVAHLGDGNVYLTPTFDLPAGEYDWEVTAYDLSGNTSHSATWHFTIDLTPPFLILHSVDDQFANPILDDNPTFAIRGPKDVTLSLSTEPWATISVRISNSTNTLYHHSYPTTGSGQASPYFHLIPGLYTVDITSFDHAGYTTSLPLFYLNITESVIAQLLPPSLTPILYQLPSPITSLPAAVQQITSRSNLAFYLLLLLAFLITTLLILLWYRRPNILILDALTDKPHRSLILYHSRPNQRLSRSPVFVTRFSPVSFSLTKSERGLLYIPRLGRYSTLTLRVGNQTHVLSLSASRRFYTIVI